jgi:WD40-like Beta Propeller Repeat
MKKSNTQTDPKSIFYILFFLLIFTTPAQAQQIQWASKVIKFSSDLGGKQNGIKRILGKPDAFPQGGSSANAWTPKNALDGREIVEVGFEKPQTVKQVAVFENLNAGCVMRIQVDTGSGNYETVWTRTRDWKTPSYKTTLTTDRTYYFKKKRRKIQEAPDVINPGIEYAILDNPVNNVVAVKIEFSFATIPGQKQIDAIGISDSEIPIQAKINTNPVFENIPNPEIIPLGDLIPSSPVVSFDGQKLFFCERTNEKERLFSCSKETNGKWSKPVEENPALSQNETYNYILAHQPNFILKGGMPYNRGTGETGYEFLDNAYQSIGLLKIAAYNNYDDTSSSSITADQKTLVMGIETDMTQGGMDLYFTNRKEDGTYGFLQNMGKSINSAANEGMPCLLSDQKTLLFCSNGFSSFGDFDIYVTHRLDDTWKKWSEPVNLGNKINSSDYEGSCFYDEKSQMLYYTRWVNDKPTLSFVSIPLASLTQF